MVRVKGCLLGIKFPSRCKLRLEIWDWMTGQKMTVCAVTSITVGYSACLIIPRFQMLDLGDADVDTCPFEFLSATSIVVVQQGALEVYEIHTESPGAPPVHTASFCTPRPNFHKDGSSTWLTGNSHLRLSHGIDYENLSERSPFPSPSFPLAEDNCYLTLVWRVHDFLPAQMSEVQFHVPLSSLRRSPIHGDALAIPWEVWSKDVYFHDLPGIHYQMSGGRLMRFTHFTDSSEVDPGWDMMLFDLNRSRAGRLSATRENSCADYAPFHALKSDVLCGEIRMKCRPPVPLVSRSFTSGGSLFSPICADEHVMLWAVCYMFVPHY
jgi:hypothetical protein